jgi:hypothetical protein
MVCYGFQLVICKFVIFQKSACNFESPAVWQPLVIRTFKKLLRVAQTILYRLGTAIMAENGTVYEQNGPECLFGSFSELHYVESRLRVNLKNHNFGTN